MPSIMNVAAVPKDARPRAPSWLKSTATSRAATRLGLRVKTQRPAISAPVGPVKNSRGPDFSRSEQLVIVDGIKDCVSPQKRAKTRDVSSRFLMETLPSKPTVSESNVTVSTTSQAPLSKNSTSQLRSASLSASPKPPRPCLKTSSTVALLPQTEPPEHDKNIPPQTNFSRPKAAPKSKPPKSRTMNVLHDLKASISRTSLNVRTDAKHSPYHSAYYSSSENTVVPPSASRLQLPESSQISLTGSSPSCTPEPDHRQVRTPQPSAYWSGRFMSLYDKFSAEILAPVPSGLIPPPAGQATGSPASSPEPPRSNTGHFHAQLPVSMTTSALTRVACAPATFPCASNEDEIVRRVFRHLESLCATDEARASFMGWQQAYARRHRRPHLRPAGPAIDSRGIMSKLFSGSGRPSLSDLRGPSNASKVVAARHMVET